MLKQVKKSVKFQQNMVQIELVILSTFCETNKKNESLNLIQ